MMKLQILLLAALTTAATAITCRTDKKFVKVGTECLYFSAPVHGDDKAGRQITQPDAAKACTAMGATLWQPKEKTQWTDLKTHLDLGNTDAKKNNAVGEFQRWY